MNNNPHKHERKMMEKKVYFTLILTTVLISVSLVRKSPLFSDIWSRKARHLNTHVRDSSHSPIVLSPGVGVGVAHGKLVLLPVLVEGEGEGEDVVVVVLR